MKQRVKSSKKTIGKTVKPVMLRERIITFSLNEPEYLAIQKYCSKYKIKNRARFLRESVMKVVLNRFSEDYPTLFGENEMR